MFDMKINRLLKKASLSHALCPTFIMLDKALFFPYHIALFMLFAPLAIMYNTIILEIAL